MDSKTEHPVAAHEVHGTPRKQGGVMNKLYPPGPQPGGKGRMKNHCRKFWWCGKFQNIEHEKLKLTKVKTVLF